jgi:hypothetical protein
MEQLDLLLAPLEAATLEPASALYFTPVSPRARHDGWTQERQRRFVAALAFTGETGKAAALAGMTAHSAARLRRRPDGASFANACREASDFAKRLRRARAAAARGAAEVAKRPERPEGSRSFSPRGSSPTASTEPSGARKRPFRGHPPGTRGVGQAEGKANGDHPRQQADGA